MLFIASSPHCSRTGIPLGFWNVSCISISFLGRAIRDDCQIRLRLLLSNNPSSTSELSFPCPCHAYIRADKDGKIIIEYVLVTLRIMAWSFYSTHGLRKMDLVEQQSSQVYTCMLERLYSRSLKLRFSFYVKSYTSLRRQFAFGILLVWAC
jgi:hypothetical protein